MQRKQIQLSLKFSELPARILRNRFVDEYAKSEVEYLEWPLQRAITED